MKPKDNIPCNSCQGTGKLLIHNSLPNETISCGNCNGIGYFLLGEKK